MYSYVCVCVVLYVHVCVCVCLNMGVEKRGSASDRTTIERKEVH